MGRLAVFLVIFGVAGSLAAVGAQSEEVSEYQVKAAFLFHFAQFVEWSANAFSHAAAPIRICVVGDDPFDGALEATGKQRSIDGHPLRVEKRKAAQDLDGCHIVFVGSSEKKHLGQIVEAARSSHALTVSDLPRFVEGEGMIGLVSDGNKLRFEINLSAIEQAGLKVSCKLVALAKNVREARMREGR